MLKSSEFNSAVPKFANGNYASNPIDPTNVEEPSAQDYVRGTEPLDTLPAQWWNWLCNQFTSRFNKLNTYVKNIFDELTGFLSLLNISPDGTESTITTGQLKNAFKENYPAYINDKLELGTTYVKRTQKVNNHALTGDVTVTKADVGLGNVANTGDSANASSNGTTKFTTGGAYNLLTSIAPYFSSTTAYTVGQLVTYQNKLYECTTSHSGTWNASHFTARTISAELALSLGFTTLANANNVGYNGEVRRYYVDTNTTNVPNGLPSSFRGILEIFRQSNGEVTWQRLIIFYYGTGYTSAVSTFSRTSYWNGSEQTWGNWREEADKADITTLSDTKADLTDIAPAFSASTNYVVGDYVTYNGNLYKCTVAHSGAWNTSDFTLVTVGSDLAIKADKTSLAVPSDAVLHYSFDEVPDYPDGTAVYYKNEDWSTIDGWQSFSYRGTLSVENGILTSTRVDSQWASLERNMSIPANSIIKIRIKDTSNTSIRVYKKTSSDNYTVLTEQSLQAGITKEIVFMCETSAVGIMLRNIEQESSMVAGKLQLEAIYIGDGSYSTPIIDNANGQNNATNNGGIAVKGVSGKGAYFPSANQFMSTPLASLPKPNSNKDLSISVWLNIKNDYIPEESDSVKPICTIGAFVGAFGLFRTRSSVGFINRDSSYARSVSIPMKKDGNWHLYTGVYDGTTHRSKLYEDGVLISASGENIADYTFGGDSVNWRVWGNTVIQGGSSTTVNQPATIDDLLIFDRALTDDEVMALYLNRGNTPKYYGEVPVTRKINGYTLEEDITLTKADVGLGNVANKNLSNVTNTGDSATPVAGGITKFTTGGAYDFFAKKNNYNDWLETVFGWSMGTSWSKASFDNPSYIGYGNGVFVTIGYSGSSYYHFYWSTDGKAWTQGDAADSYLNSCYFNGNLFVAITDLHAYWSTDGKTWTQGSGTSFNMGNSASSVYYANNIWVITGTDRHTYWSTDGKTWTLQNSNLDMDGSVVRYANGLWVIGGNALYWSTDGKTWTQGSGGGRSGSVVYNNGIWVSVGNNPYWSTDGKTWTQGSGFSSSHGLCYGNGIWITLSGSNGYKSTDGKTWTSVSLGGSGGASASIYFSNGIWVYSSYTTTGGQGVVTRSIDGENWERVTTGLSGSDHNFGKVICKNGIWIVTDAHYNAIYSSSYRSLLPNYGN